MNGVLWIMGWIDYISHCLKNWAAKYHPPVDGRVKLLRKAGLSPFIRNSQPLFGAGIDFSKPLFFGE